MDVEQVASREASLALIGIIHIELNARRKHHRTNNPEVVD